jgi:hypothetical protein
MAFDLATYLLDSAVRLQRNSWGGGQTQKLSQEIFSLLTGIQPPVRQVTVTDDNGNPFVVPPMSFPTIDPIIFNWDDPGNPIYDPPSVIPPANPSVNPNDPQDPNVTPPDGQPTTTSQSKVYRNVFPGQILSSSGNDFEVMLYPSGLQDISDNRVVIAQCADASQASSVSAGTWVLVFMAVHYLETVTAIPAAITTGDLQAENVEYLFTPSGGGGAGLAVTTSAIAGRSDPHDPRSEIGTGSAILRVFINGAWIDGDAVTLYNSTSTDVGENKLIQWHTIAGFRFVDVEDCGQ